MNSVPKLATLMLVLLLIASTVQKEPLKQDEGKSVDPKQNPSGKSTNITIGGGSGIPGLTLTIGKDSKGEAPKQAPSASSNTPGSNGVKPAQVIVVTSSNHDPNKKPVTPQDYSHDLKSSPSGSAPTLKIVVGSGNSGQPSSDTPKGNAAPPVQSGNIGSNGGNSKISVVIVSPGQTGGSVNGASSRMASVPVSAVSTTVTPATGGNDVTKKESKKDKAPLDLPTTDHEKEKWKHDCEQNITEWSATVKKILDYRKAALKSNIPENPDKVKNDTNTLQQIVNWCWLGRRIARKLGAADLGSRLFTIIFLANGDTYEKQIQQREAQFNITCDMYPQNQTSALKLINNISRHQARIEAMHKELLLAAYETNFSSKKIDIAALRWSAMALKRAQLILFWQDKYGIPPAVLRRPNSKAFYQHLLTKQIFDMNSRVTGISIMMKMYNATKPLLAENKVAEQFFFETFCTFVSQIKSDKWECNRILKLEKCDKFFPTKAAQTIKKIEDAVYYAKYTVKQCFQSKDS